MEEHIRMFNPFPPWVRGDFTGLLEAEGSGGCNLCTVTLLCSFLEPSSAAHTFYVLKDCHTAVVHDKVQPSLSGLARVLEGGFGYRKVLSYVVT